MSRSDGRLLAPVSDSQMLGSARRRHFTGWAGFVDLSVVFGLPLLGLLCPQGPRVFYTSLAKGFFGIAGFVLLGCALSTFLSERREDRLQGPRRKPALILRGAFDTTLAAWVAACLLAWPLSRLAVNAPTGLTDSIEHAGGPVRAIVQTVLGVIVLDAWLYWKHRLLHSRFLFPFHRGHHVYRDPTAFAGFAVGPVESLLTFWPVVIWAHPKAVHFAPLYYALVAGFIVLNFYLHCGVSLRIFEKLLPPFFVNTSAFHNRHHANAEVNFGEALTLWDHLCRTHEAANVARRKMKGSTTA